MKTLHEEMELGARAQATYNEVEERINLIRENLHAKWEDSKAEDAEGREQAWFMLKALKELERSFLRDITTGKMAKAQIGSE